MSRPDTPLEAALRRNGIVHPQFTVEHAEKAGLPVQAACAILMLETSGGLNEFGHDPGNRVQGGWVTEWRYHLMREGVRQGEPSQGVGPCQLTSTHLQDEADGIGGCWDIGANMQIGFTFVRQLRHEFGDWAGFYHYNGSGPAAAAYAFRATAIEARFALIVRV